MVTQGDGKGKEKEMGRQTKTYVEVAMGGGEGRRVAVHGMSQSLALQQGEKDKKKW